MTHHHVRSIFSLFKKTIQIGILSASGIERCRNEDKECLVNAWNKYVKQAGGTNGKLLYILCVTKVKAVEARAF